MRSPAALALRVTALATPLLLGALAVPSGGLFRGAKFRDLHLYREYGDALLDGRLPYRDVFVEYPPGAIPLFAAPSLAPGLVRPALQGADDALRRGHDLPGGSPARPARCGRPRTGGRGRVSRAGADRARPRFPEHLRRVACAVDGRRACGADVRTRDACARAARRGLRSEAVRAGSRPAGADPDRAGCGLARVGGVRGSRGGAGRPLGRALAPRRLGRASAPSSAGGCTRRAWARACCSRATASVPTTRTSSSACTRRRRGT